MECHEAESFEKETRGEDFEKTEEIKRVTERRKEGEQQSLKMACSLISQQETSL